ncbi:MAG: rhomboid family intramembrane serine protease [Spirochaetales bacterium]|nr:rhomboid family intramembrane serine protease [Spirochaetales bacterium]
MENNEITGLDRGVTAPRGFRIRYNAPVILSYTIICTVLVFIAQFIPAIMSGFFSVPGKGMGFRFFSLDALRLVTHAMGHSGWAHLVNNFTFILLIGPVLEEKYGSIPLLIMMIVTALVTGILNVLFFDSGLLGASGIVFMLILLISFTNIQAGEIPLTFILISLLFLGKEIYAALFEQNNISEFAHIIGGACGSLFGFIFPIKTGKKSADVISA